ncbi:hypothetical protein OESDEN_04830 [Oesophagostomum dentatum]|uniref:G-protein coupled receptors family 1 profile domain-containing protein n=1 Tax=Oesophagostomum dentatum TaxID=61180 RepID=A0A0B1TCH0_OESDE|nr:hypothetical protein OESDEN_04830 [Oesophagostomum dentatum]
MILYLVVTDFILVLTVTPYAIFLTSSWDPNEMDLNPYVIILLGMPPLIQMKGNLLLTAAIAVERNLALFMPLLYRKLSSARFAAFALIFAYSSAIFDPCFALAISPFQRKPNCAAAGCFMNKSFLSYWVGSNMVSYLSPKVTFQRRIYMYRLSASL